VTATRIGAAGWASLTPGMLDSERQRDACAGFLHGAKCFGASRCRVGNRGVDSYNGRDPVSRWSMGCVERGASQPHRVNRPDLRTTEWKTGSVNVQRGMDMRVTEAGGNERGGDETSSKKPRGRPSFDCPGIFRSHASICPAGSWEGLAAAFPRAAFALPRPEVNGATGVVMLGTARLRWEGCIEQVITSARRPDRARPACGRCSRGSSPHDWSPVSYRTDIDSNWVSRG
jgi:hypothetical protein